MLTDIDIIAAIIVEDINKDTEVPILWYENKDGEKWIPDLNKDGFPEPPEGYIYQHSQFPSMLTHNMLKIVQKEEVEKCQHPEKYVVPTFGWIDGIVGRECKRCFGSQTKDMHEEWSNEWDSHGSRQVMEGHSGWSEDLVLEMANSGYKLGQAILIVANSCERCMNVLADEHGLKWGYAKDSEEYEGCNTECEFCK